jgi:hypothetical protein
MYRLFMAAFIAIAIIFAPWLSLRADAVVVGPSQARVAKFWIGKPYYEVDGKKYDMDVAPYIKNDRTMIPVRYLAYSLGIPEDKVKWWEEGQGVTAERGEDSIYLNIGQKVFSVNGKMTAGHFDVVPEIIPPGRVMIPYRAVAQALGGMVFWNDAEQCVTVETWRELPPYVPMDMRKVSVYRDALYADVVKSDGTAVKVNTDNPVMIRDFQDGGFTLDAVEWFKLWGVPESSMLYDPVRGGLMIRGRGGNGGQPGSFGFSYAYFYKGEKTGWDCFFDRVTKKDDTSTTNNFIGDNGRFYSGAAAAAVVRLFGKNVKWDLSSDYKVLHGTITD